MKIFQNFILLTLVTLGSLQLLIAQEQNTKPNPYLLKVKWEFDNIPDVLKQTEVLMIDGLAIQKNTIYKTTSDIELDGENDFKKIVSSSKDSLGGYFLTDYTTKKTYEFDANKNLVKVLNNSTDQLGLMFLKTDSLMTSLAPKYVLKGDTLLNGQKCKKVVYKAEENGEAISHIAYIAERIKGEKVMNVMANSLEERFNGTCVAIDFHDMNNQMKTVQRVGFSYNRNVDPEERKLANFFYDWFQKQKKENLSI